MNVWITATANYSLTYGFEELLDECFMTGSCVFLSMELMYLGAVYLHSLPCCEYCREKTKFSTRALAINQSFSHHAELRLPCLAVQVKALLNSVANRSCICWKTLTQLLKLSFLLILTAFSQKLYMEPEQLSNLHFLLSYSFALFLIFPPFFFLFVTRLQVLLLAYLSSVSFTKICLSACQTTQLETQKQFKDEYFSLRIAPRKECSFFLLS